jgi:hypothetical protein
MLLKSEISLEPKIKSIGQNLSKLATESAPEPPGRASTYSVTWVLTPREKEEKIMNIR